MSERGISFRPIWLDNWEYQGLSPGSHKKMVDVCGVRGESTTRSVHSFFNNLCFYAFVLFWSANLFVLIRSVKTLFWIERWCRGHVTRKGLTRFKLSLTKCTENPHIVPQEINDETTWPMLSSLIYLEYHNYFLRVTLSSPAYMNVPFFQIMNKLDPCYRQEDPIVFVSQTCTVSQDEWNLILAPSNSSRSHIAY